MTGKTVSSVSTMDGLRAQRWQALGRDQSALAAMSVFAQLWISFALYLYGHVSTPGAFSLLLTLPYLLLIWFMGRFLARGAKQGEDAVASAVGNKAAKAFYFLFSLLHFMDAQLTLYAFCAVAGDVMPGHSALSTTLAVALLCFAALDRDPENVLPRLARLLKWAVGALLLYCALIALPYGKTAHFFPLLGFGPSTIGKGAFWLCGAVSGGVWPLILPQSGEIQRLMAQKPRICLKPWLISVGAGLAMYGLSVWLLPVYAMARPQSLGWRMLAVTHMTPSVPAWSMEVMGLFLLLLLSLAHSVFLSAKLIERGAGKKKRIRFLPLLLLLLLCPASILKLPSINLFLVSAAPLRGVAALGLLAALCLCSLMKRKKESAAEDRV